MLDWNDLRYLIAVSRDGSTLAAGRALRVSQTTVARRLAALEAALGLTLVERLPSGYRLTAAGESLIDHARRMEEAADALAHAAAAQARNVSGLVKLSTEEIIAVTLLVPILGDIAARYPDLRIEVESTDAVRDLAAGEADIALRSCTAPEGAGLVGRRLGDDVWSFYCSRAYAVAHGLDDAPPVLAEHPIIGGGGAGLWRHYRPWLERLGLTGSIALHQGSTMGLLAAVRAGLGFAILPRLLADNDPELVRYPPESPRGGRGLWLLTHERLRHTPRVRAVLDIIADRMPRMVD